MKGQLHNAKAPLNLFVPLAVQALVTHGRDFEGVGCSRMKHD
jgi:hypothetical protein